MGKSKETEAKRKTVKSPADQEIMDSENQNGLIVNSSFVCVREHASETSSVKDYLQKDDKVEIVDEDPNGFYLVKYGRAKRLGFVSHNCVWRCGHGRA